MLKILSSCLFVVCAINLAGCAGFTIADKLRMASNHRDIASSAEPRQCEPGLRAEPFEHITDGEALDPEGFRLLNWNIYKGSRKDWQEDFQRLAGDSDIVALQEAHLHNEFHAELKESDLHWDLTTAFFYAGAETGVLIGSEIKSGLPCTLHANEPLIMTPKTALVTEYQVRGLAQTLLVANIHMINFSFGTHEYEQQIDQLMKVIQHHEGPMIITGDFNTWSEERMTIVDNMALKLALLSVEYDDDHRLTIFGNPLDHVYFRGLEALHANTEKVESSDHNPMMVTFRVSSL
jgi:endonuclease/exonuclease/phosphatase (EEP) superfamily protein YafD